MASSVPSPSQPLGDEHVAQRAPLSDEHAQAATVPGPALPRGMGSAGAGAWVMASQRWQANLVSRNGQAQQRLLAYPRIELAKGTSGLVDFTIDPRLLADWRDGGWTMPGGKYVFAMGENAEVLGSPITVTLPGRSWHDPHL